MILLLGSDFDHIVLFKHINYHLCFFHAMQCVGDPDKMHCILFLDALASLDFTLVTERVGRSFGFEIDFKFKKL